MSTSVTQEFYKLREDWNKIDKLQSWRLAVWVAEYPDLDIIDKFMEIERSPIGHFDDIFFKFESVYQGDSNKFEKSLWEEFISWFSPVEDPKIDIHLALYESGLITEKFIPNQSLEPTAKNLWAELLRFRNLIKNVSNKIHFCIYFPIVGYNTITIENWFKDVINTVPKEIRLVTVDFAQDRKIHLDKKLNGSSAVVYLYPKLDMLNAIKNEMAKDSENYDTVDLNARFRQQVIKLMDSTTTKINNQTESEVKKLFSITKDLGTLSAHVSGLLVASQAYYAINKIKKSASYVEEALIHSKDFMDKGDATGYPIWKSCMLLKAALFFGKKKYKEAQDTYEEMADEAIGRGDAYYGMEGKRLSAHISYEMGDLHKALESFLLALATGAYLDLSMRRQSTFLHAAHMANHIGNQILNTEQVLEIKLQLKEWLGEDWESLLQQEGVDAAELKM